MLCLRRKGEPPQAPVTRVEIDRVDVALLRRQVGVLAGILNAADAADATTRTLTPREMDALDGILNLCDAILGELDAPRKAERYGRDAAGR